MGNEELKEGGRKEQEIIDNSEQAYQKTRQSFSGNGLCAIGKRLKNQFRPLSFELVAAATSIGGHRRRGQAFPG